MSNAVVSSLKSAFDRSCGMLEQFIDVCPDEIWNKKFGGWPIWRQIYHAVGTIDFFVAQSAADFGSKPLAPEAGNLSADYSGPAATKAQVKTLMTAMQAKAEAYFAGLTDASLAGKNEGLSSRLNMDFSHATTCSMLAGHALYHLGSGDAALREAGLKGIF